MTTSEGVKTKRIYIMQKTNIMSCMTTHATYLVRHARPGYARDCNGKNYNLFNAFFLFAPAVSFAVLFTALVVVFVAAFPVMLALAVPRGDR